MLSNTANIRTPKNIAYLRVSTAEQDLEKNKADILHFANNSDFGKVEFVMEGKEAQRGR